MQHLRQTTPKKKKVEKCHLLTIVINIFHREEIKENKKQVYPACLPRTNDQYFGSSRLWVAGWGLVRQRRLRNVRL